MVDDMTANHGHAWGFPLDRIRTKIHLCFCELDRSVLPAMGRYLSNTVLNCEATLVPDAGYLWIFLHLNDVLTELMVGQQETKTHEQQR